MRFKKMFSSAAALLALTLLLSSAQPAYAVQIERTSEASAKSSEVYESMGLSSYKYIVLRNGDIEITDFNGFARELTIPTQIDGHKVTAIASLSLSDGILSVTLPSSVKRVDRIDGNTLIKITMSEGVEEIGEYAFGFRTDGYMPTARNAALTKVELPSTLKKIGEGAFEGCGNLNSVNFPKGCEIEKRAFYRCHSLPCPEDDVINAAGSLAFADTQGYGTYSERTRSENDCDIIGNRLIGCRSKERVLEIPEGVEYIDFNFTDTRNDSTPGFYFQEVVLPSTIKVVTGFDDCQELVKVTFKGVPEEISSFNNCPRLSDITFPEGTKRIAGFSNCPSLTSVDIPASVEKIAGFDKNENLESVTFHDGHLKVIEEDSFSECGKLNNVSLPSPLEEIGEGAFTQCPVLKNITFPDTVYRVFTNLENEPWYYEQPLGEPLYIGSCYMGFPYDYYEEYPESVKLKANTKGISAKYGPTKYDLPATLKFVGNISNLNIEDLVLPEGVECIAKWSIIDNNNVKTITIPKSVKFVGYQAMYNCSNLEKVTFKGNPDIVEDSIFNLDGKLKTIEVPDDFDACVFSKGSEGYYESYQKGYTTESYVETAEKEYKGTKEYGLDHISVSGDELESIVIPKNVQRVEINAPNLKTLTVPNTVKDLTIYGKTKLTTLDLPKGIQRVSIGESSLLKTINAPDSLIEAYCSEETAWYKAQPDGPIYLGKCLIGCKGDMPDNYKLVVPEGIKSVCHFPSNNNLKELTLPSTCLYADGFEECSALTKLDLGAAVYVASGAFRACPITDLKIGDGCRYIGGSAFTSTVLETLTFPDSMEFVGQRNFDAQKVYVSKNMHTADSYSDLDSVVYNTGVTTEDRWSNVLRLFNTKDDDPPVIIGYGGTAFEEYVKNFSSFGYTFIDMEKGEASETGGYTFDEKTGALVILSDEGMTEWAQKYRSKTGSAYSGASVKPTFPEKLAKVKNVTIGENVTTIEPFAFSYCTSLEDITIPSNVTLISEGAFESCTSLKNVTISKRLSDDDNPQTLRFSPSIGSSVESGSMTATLNNCPSLESITVPQSADIPCIWNCQSFKEINIQYKCGENGKDDVYTNLDENQFMNVSDELAINVPKEYEDIWKAEFPYFEDLINKGSKKIYRLSVNGKRFSSSDLTIPCGNGTAEFDPNTNTLTLTNAEITRTSVDFYHSFKKSDNGVWDSPNSGIKSALDSLNLVLVGENKIFRAREENNEYESYYYSYIIHGIQTTGSLSISGSGSLKVESTSYTGIDCGGDLKLNGASVECVYVSDNFESGRGMLGFMDASSIEINDCELFGFYLWSKNEISLNNTKLNTNGQSIIFGSTFSAKKCDITVVNEYASNGGAFLINTEEDVEGNPKFQMTFEETTAHISVTGMVTNLYVPQIKCVGEYGVISGDWDARKLELGRVIPSADKKTGIEALNIGDYTFSVQEIDLEHDYNGLYNGMYNYASGYLKLFSGNRPEYRILKAYKLTLKDKNDKEVSGEPFTFKVPIPESLAPENELTVFGFKPNEETDQYDYEQSPYRLTEMTAPIRDGYFRITADDYDKGIFAVVAPESYYIPKPPISGTVTGTKTGSEIKVSLFDVKEGWEVSNTRTTSDPFNFEFKNLSDGTYLLRAEEDEHTPYERTVRVVGDSAIVLNITLRPLGEESTCEVVSSTLPDSSDNTYGDLDGDGSVTANDALMILRQSVGLATFTPEQTTMADVDNDGAITANDALAVLRYSVGLGGNDKIGKPIAS